MDIIKEARHYGSEVSIDLWYPRSPGNSSHIEIGLVDVRAADSIRVSYDFERDGWKIEQASRFSWEDDDTPDRDWQEVSFVQAWARQAHSAGGEA